MECVRPGEWTAQGIVCYRTMEGTIWQSWEAYPLPEGMDGNDLIRNEINLSGLIYGLVADGRFKQE